MKTRIKKFYINNLKKAKERSIRVSEIFIKWGILSLITGVITGFAASTFHLALMETVKFRQKYSFSILLLPLCGILIVALYKKAGLSHDKGTNRVIMAVRDDEKMTWRNVISIYIGSVLTHIGGGSAGREGAALQIGGGIGSQLGIWFKLSNKDCRMLTLCGMSAGFSALFGTPVAAAFFSMEVINIGTMHYYAIVPCIISALTGFAISSHFGVSAAVRTVIFPDSVKAVVYIKVAVIAVLCALLSIIFCYALKTGSHFFRSLIKNPYFRIAAGGCTVAALTFIVGTYDYNGLGSEAIGSSFLKAASWEEFALKMLFTVVTLSSGFKGGEIMPSFFIGASFGSAFAPLLGLDCSLGAAAGLACMFCGVTNCPVTAICMCAELFGTDNLPVYMLACGISYMLSGYASLYSEQNILYSKLEPRFIDKKISRV